MKARLDDHVTLELKCFRLDHLAFEANVTYSSKLRITVPEIKSPVMRFLCNSNCLELGGVEELRMEGLVGPLEPQPVELLSFLKRMPALTRVITGDGNEEALRFVLDSICCQAIVER